MTQVLSTLRLQFHRDFTFADAQRHIDYFAALGVSHLYASPITTSQPGSTHGYDTVDYTRVNPELGGEDGLRALVAALRTRGMGLIIDIVPNHMGVGGADNHWWLDILEWGRHAAHARYFDIDWHSPDPALRGKVLAPFLGESFGDALAEGKIALKFDDVEGRFHVDYYSHRFPICPSDYPKILAHASSPATRQMSAHFEGLGHTPEDQLRAASGRAALSAFVAHPGTLDGEDLTAREAITHVLSRFAGPEAGGHAGGHDALQRLLDHQHYRLAWWRSASDEVNWRRFFDISALAGMRVERGEVFDASHALILRLYAEGLIDGVRIDHVDGLAEPREYCTRLRARLDLAHQQRPPALRAAPPYLVVEKILARGEAMRKDWKIDGTTGYDFLNDVGAFLHDPEGAEPLAQLWHQISGRPEAFIDEALPARRKVLAENLSAELDRAARALHRIARDAAQTRDYTFTSIRRVLIELAVHYPVYRIYPVDGVRSAEDERYFSHALDGARASLRRADHGLLDQMDQWLGSAATRETTQDGTTQDNANAAEGVRAGRADLRTDPRAAHNRIALTLFSQLTSPVAAKSVEDTACYRYGRLISRNEVGADPDDFSISADALHAINADRAAHFPRAMLTTATHDHKRGEDVRARIAVLSEIPVWWAATLKRWSMLNAPHAAQGGQAPGPGFESMLYQTLLGCWPPSLASDDEKGIASLLERLTGWQEKALREAKLDTDWFAPNGPYEDASRAFLADILSPQLREGFLAALTEAVAALAPAGAINSLQQTLLRVTSPGIPDLYQGTEWWDWSLVDPDNRRPVDYPARATALNAMDAVTAAVTKPGSGSGSGSALDAVSDADASALGVAATLADLLPAWRDGRIKQGVIHRALLLRRQVPALFTEGRYLPIVVEGTHARSVFAFARHTGQTWAITVTTRLAAHLLGVATDMTGEHAQGTAQGISTAPDHGAALPLVEPGLWQDTRLILPPELMTSLTTGSAAEPAALTDHLSMQSHPCVDGVLRVADVLANLPVALLSNVMDIAHNEHHPR
jgi:(1->4)-alpha-D-glucan 1-alpha-D-glucosylmutase